MRRAAERAVSRLPLSPEDREDAVQDAMLSFVLRGGGFRGEGAQQTTWMHRVAVNAAFMVMRRRRNEVRRAERFELLAFHGDHSPGADLCAAAQLVLDKLKPGQREVFLATELLGETVGEVAERVGTSKATVNRLLARARAGLERAA